jgi:4-amino-4-deoxy-L-arabinose transferase-like glycosyltransferase
MAVYYYIPITCSGSADLKFLFFVLLALEAFISWREQRDDRYLWLAGLETGLSLHYRYHGVILWGVLSSLLLWSARVDRKEVSIWKRFALFAALVAAVGSPWLLRNTIEMGNPFSRRALRFLTDSVAMRR